MSGGRRFGLGSWLAALAAVGVPLALLADLNGLFYVDWYNNLWLTGMNGAWLRWHHVPPTVLNTSSFIGIGAPIFYGYLLYPFLGVFSAALGAQAAIRVGCVLAVGVEFLALYLAGRNVFRHRGLAYAFAATLAWSVYSLTNLYNRSAVPEFFAIAFLTAAVGFLAAAVTEESRAGARGDAWMAALCGTLAVGSHPPTAVAATPLLVGLVVLGVFVWRTGRERRAPEALKWGGAAATVGVMAIAPWVYATAKWARALKQWSAPFSLLYFPERSDGWLGRFGPFPYDALSLDKGGQCATPYLETPIAFGLWVLLAWLGWSWWSESRTQGKGQPGFAQRLARWVLPVALAWSAAVIVISFCPAVGNPLRALGPLLQFAYRLVGHANVGLATAVLAAGMLGRGDSPAWRRQATATAAAVLVLAAIGAGIKLTHGAAVMAEDSRSAFAPGGDRSALIAAPPSATGFERMYSTPSRLRALAAAETGGRQVTFVVGTSGANFGIAQPVEAREAAAGWVATNVCVFPFCRIYADGRRLTGDDLARVGDLMAVRLPAGVTTLRWECHPDPVWAWLHGLGMAAFAALFAGAIWLGIRARGSRTDS